MYKMNRIFIGTKIGYIFILISILFVGSYGLVLPGSTYITNPEASISIDCSVPLPGEISPAIYGGFIEFIGYCINGPIGLWAQELRNRGFDEPDEDLDGISGQGIYGWQPLADPDITASWSLSDDGYNTRGVHAQRVSKISGMGRVGLYQLIPISEQTGLDFYVYLYGDSTVGDITLAVADVNGSHIYAQTHVGVPEGGWRKVTATFPPVTDVAIGRLEISWTGNGMVCIDEASLMPSDNINGVRREFFELYYEWQPGVLRYPGGCFADSPANHWIYGVGPIDQRKSPNWDPYWKSYQRMDFGIDEFIAFCKACNVEPHITVNFGSGTVEEAAALVEYCNGPINSTYGALRAANGHPEPYDVKYWEIGNEQYGNWEIGHTTPEEYGARFVEYYHAMKAVDPTVRIMANGDANPEWYLPMMDAIGREIDVFGWHTCHVVDDFVSDEDIYLSMLARSMSTERTIESFWNQAIESGLAPDMQLSISEWWPEYHYSDSSGMRVGSLESALWSALHLNAFQRHADAMETACRTVFIGVIAPMVDADTGSRIILATPTYYVFKMYRHYSGDHGLAVEVDCPTYDTPGVPHFAGERDVPYLDASATMSNGSFYLAVVNRHPTDAMHTAIQWNGIAATEGTIHELSSDSYLDGNDWEDPNKITINSHTWVPSEYYDFPPHSVTIIEIPNSTETPFVDITRPKEKSLYIQDKKPMTLPKNTVIIGEITIRVNAYSEDGIDKVELYIDNLLKETIDELPYEWTWNEFAIGKHEIKAIAYDNSGNKAEDEIDVIIFNLGGEKKL